jgi:hypothetical protein
LPYTLIFRVIPTYILIVSSVLMAVVDFYPKKLLGVENVVDTAYAWEPFTRSHTNWVCAGGDI